MPANSRWDLIRGLKGYEKILGEWFAERQVKTKITLEQATKVQRERE